MTIDWAAIKDSVADAIAVDMANAAASSFAQLKVSNVPLHPSYTWDGTDTVLTSDTSQVSVSPPSFIRLQSNLNWYKVVAIDPNVSVTVQDVFGVGYFPTGSTLSVKSLGPLPAAPPSATFRDKMGVPIANAVVDGIKTALDQAQIEDVAGDSGNVVGPGVIV